MNAWNSAEGFRGGYTAPFAKTLTRFRVGNRSATTTLRFGDGLRSMARLAQSLSVGLDVLPAFSQRHDVIADDGSGEAPVLRALGAQRLTVEEPLAQLLQLGATNARLWGWT